MQSGTDGKGKNDQHIGDIGVADGVDKAELLEGCDQNNRKKTVTGRPYLLIQASFIKETGEQQYYDATQPTTPYADQKGFITCESD